MKSTPSPSRSALSPGSAEAIQPTGLVGNDPERNTFWSIAFVSALAGVFILYSRLFDVAANGFKIPRIVLSLMVFFFLLSGRPLVFLRSATGKFMISLLVWTTLTVITSIWKGGSLPAYYQLCQSTLMFAIAAGLLLKVRNVRTAMNGLAFSGLCAALLSIPFGDHPFDRLALTQGSYHDPNYYSLALVLVVPFFWGMAASTKSYFVKILAWVSLLPIFLAIARSGSRGAMLGFLVMLLLLFLISAIKTKVIIIVGTVLGFVFAVAVTPDYIRARYLTFFQIDSKTAQQFDNQVAGGISDLDRLRADTGSAEDRQRLLISSVQLTLEHPLVGVGPGNFPTAVYDENKAAGIVRNEWLVTHNSYTEISSETGIPGLILFVGLLVTAFKSTLFVLKQARPEGEKPDAEAYSVAKYLLLSMSALAVCIFFLAVGYEFVIYLWAGLTASLRRTYEEKVASIPEPAADMQPAIHEGPLATPAYAKVVDRPSSPARRTPKGGGRPVRFNRFR